MGDLNFSSNGLQFFANEPNYPKKGDVKQQHMGFEMSQNSMKDNMQKGLQIEVNLPTLAYFLIIL